MQDFPYLSGFRVRLILMVLMVMLPTFALVLHGNLEQRRIQKAAIREQALAISELAAANQENFIKNTRQLFATLTELPGFLLDTNRAAVQRHLSNLLRLTPDYLNIGLAETNGMLFCSSLPTEETVYLGDRPYFQRVMETRRFAMGDFQVGRVTGEPTLNFGYPVLNERGEVRRILFAALKLRLLSDAVAHITLPPGGSISVMDGQGTVLARQPEPEKWVGESLLETPLAERVLDRRERVFESAGMDGVARLHAVTSIEYENRPGLFVKVGIPLETSFAAADAALLRNLLVFCGVAAIVLIATGMYAERCVIRPIQRLVTATEQLAEGNLSARVGGLGGAGELGRLSRAFDLMAERLQQRQEELEHAHREISHLNADLERRIHQRTAQLEETNKELEAFSYSVSHDLRAPLRHMNGFVDLLKRNANGLAPDNLRYIDFISGSAQQMGRLVDDLLSFSRMARSEMHRTEVNLENLVADVRRQLENETAGRAVEWQIHPLPRVQGDPSMLRVVLMNLLSNAIKYTGPRNPARIEIGARIEGDEDVIYVRDNGVGFDMKYAGKLFGVFQRLHYEDEFEGTGIGLANVRRVVLRHGGRVWGEGREGEGAAFYFTLPRQPAPVSPAEPQRRND